MGLSIRPNQIYFGGNSKFINDERLDNMYCNVPPNKKAAEEIAKKYNKTSDVLELSSKQSEQDRYEQYLKMMAFSNPLMCTTPLFIYEAAKEKASQETSPKQNTSNDDQHDKKTVSVLPLPGGWLFTT